ncbi:hypothetical protein BMMGA3_11690 [Bacillus methanolicus MGA3]|uniref:Uncharacterized protein n=1 Tax=Bacillus methanolicus (strain MGA3 / ATCC 53907) TaxID=796606 RepID=A0A068LUY8_BACMM|nr:hypothetical protein BMMGA3_11690 [Bacillus methanolicus MGA3]
MIRMLTTIIMIGTACYIIYQNRYRLVNVLFGNSFIRRFLVSIFMNVPGVQNRIIQSVYPSRQY